MLGWIVNVFCLCVMCVCVLIKGNSRSGAMQGAQELQTAKPGLPSRPSRAARHSIYWCVRDASHTTYMSCKVGKLPAFLRHFTEPFPLLAISTQTPENPPSSTRLKDNSGILNIDPPFCFVKDEIQWLTQKCSLLVVSRGFG